MKTVYAFLILFFIVQLSFAQTEKGSFLIGGSFNYYHSKSDRQLLGNAFSPSYTKNGLNLTPEIGYFIFKNFAIGLGINLHRVKSVITSAILPSGLFNGSVRELSITAGPFAKYYILFNSKTAMFLSSGILYGPGSNISIDKRTSVTGETTTRNTFFFVSSGFTYFINRNVGLEILAKYSIYNTNIHVPASNQFLPPNSGAGTIKSNANMLLVNLGCQIYLSKQ